MEIRVENINYIYGQGTVFERRAIKDMSFQIHPSEFIAVIGHTGSGKSTLLQHLNGLIRATSGHIYCDEQDIYDKKYDMKSLRSKVGLVFQYPEDQLFENDIYSDVTFGPKNMGIVEPELYERAKRALDIVGIDESLFYKSPLELSGGQKRRVAIAGVLAMQPDILILDEPTAGLDPKGRREILERISSLHKENGTTVIMASHSMDDVAEYATRVMVIDDGALVYDDTPQRVFAHSTELVSMGLDIPQMTHLADRLRSVGMNIPEGILTVDEAASEILRELGV